MLNSLHIHALAIFSTCSSPVPSQSYTSTHILINKKVITSINSRVLPRKFPNVEKGSLFPKLCRHVHNLFKPQHFSLTETCSDRVLISDNVSRSDWTILNTGTSHLQTIHNTQKSTKTKHKNSWPQRDGISDVMYRCMPKVVFSNSSQSFEVNVEVHWCCQQWAQTVLVHAWLANTAHSVVSCCLVISHALRTGRKGGISCKQTLLWHCT